MVVSISIEGNNLHIELEEISSKIITKTMPLFGPMLAAWTTMFCRFIVAVASLGRDKVVEMQERAAQGEDIISICEAVGINIKPLSQPFEDIKWPSDKEMDEIMGWLK